MLQRPARSCARHPDSSPAMASSLAGQIVTFYAVDMPAFTGRLRSAQEWPRAGRASACCSRTSPSSFSPPSRALSKAPSERWQGRTDGCDAAFVGRALRVANFLATRKPVHDRDSGTNFFRAGRPRSRSVQLIQIVYNYCRPGESTAANSSGAVLHRSSGQVCGKACELRCKAFGGARRDAMPVKAATERCGHELDALAKGGRLVGLFQVAAAFAPQAALPGSKGQP
jgi:hypothetical protein